MATVAQMRRHEEECKSAAMDYNEHGATCGECGMVWLLSDGPAGPAYRTPPYVVGGANERAYSRWCD